MKTFSADGIWYDDYIEIPFIDVTSVTFDARYCTYWEKYLSKNE